MELAHGEACAGRLEPARTIAAVNQREQTYLHLALGARLGRRPTSEELVILQMTLQGLRAAMAAPVAPVSVAAALAAVDRLIGAFGASSSSSTVTPKPNE
ncbi:hypothetical protein [Nocardioides sp. Iso805N]|uniref:hypothetical protein n=1 Tax=Nocardioides sp. Iso805N TaxID=1283287 RepID=UPI000380ED7A|nr:hypothetical protein [Nocardioides sp. Iso805N]